MKTQDVKKGTIQPTKPFQTLEQEADYWDTQNILHEIIAGAVVGVHQANMNDTLTIRFSHEDVQKLRAEAAQQGVGPSTLARMLIKRGLQTR